MSGVFVVALAVHGYRFGGGFRLDRGTLGVVLGTMKFLFELVFGTTEFTHAAAEAAGKGGKLFRAKENQHEQGDDDHFPGSEGSDGKKVCVHGGIDKVRNRTAQTGLSPEFTVWV